LTAALRARILARIIEATPAGVGVELVESISATPFTFGVAGLGFNQGNLVTVYA
jgi:hypothetical protein